MTTTRRPLTTAGASVLLAVIALAGCSQDEPATQEPSASSAPSDDDAATSTAPQEDEGADDAAVTSSAPAEDDAALTSEPEEPAALGSVDETFEITLPSGWEDATDLAGEDAVWAARQTERLDEFHTNVTVTQEEYVGNLTPAVENTAEELAGEDGEYEILEPAEVDGHLAPGYTLTREVQGVTLQQTQRWISREGTLHVVTFSAVESQAEEAAPMLDEILSSWTWTD